MSLVSMIAKAYVGSLVKVADNVLCINSCTCTHFQISTNLSVPLLIHGVSHSIF